MKIGRRIRGLSSFVVGMLAMAVLITLVEPAIAAGEKIAYNQIGIRVMQEQKVEAGEYYTAPNGQQVPSSITYTDAVGGTTNYLSVRQLSELLDTDISWNAELNSVDIGVSPTRGEVIVTSGVSNGNSPSSETGTQMPEYGLVIGGLEEIDPESVKEVVATDPMKYPGGIMFAHDMHVQYAHGAFPEITVTPHVENGQYLVYTVTNNGAETSAVTVNRKVTVSLGRWEKFTTVNVEPGETLVRVFRILEDSDPMQRTFNFGVDGSQADVTVSLVQYR